MRTAIARESLEREFAELEDGQDIQGSLLHAVRCASLAPSSNNRQPWLFGLGGAHVDLWADRSRALPVVDPFDRELVIACGAALFHLRIALQRLGWRVQVDLLPDPHSPDHLARVELEARESPSAETRILYESIPRRHTNWNPFEERRVHPALVGELVRCANSEGVWLAPLEGQAKLEAAQLIAEADRRQLRDPHFRRELAAWMSNGRSQRRDGLPGSILDSGPLPSPLLLTLGTWHEEPAEWLAAGQALEHVLLAATAANLQASFLNQPVEVSEFRHRLRGLAGWPGFAQLVLRLGYGPPAPASPRRGLDELLLPADETLAPRLP